MAHEYHHSYVRINPKELSPGSVLISPREDGNESGFTIYTKTYTLFGKEADASLSESGPNPLEYMLISLGTCTALALKKYAKDKNLELPTFHIALSQHQHTAGEESITHIIREIVMESEIDQQLQEELTEIVNHCAMYKTLSGGFMFDTKFIPVNAQDSLKETA